MVPPDVEAAAGTIAGVSAAVEAAPPRPLAPGVAVAASLPALAAALLLLVSGRPLVALAALVAVGALAAGVLRVEAALLLLVATGPLEAALGASSSGLLSPSKLAGLLCFGSFGLWALATRRPLRFDRSHALLFGLLALAMVSTLQARSVADGAQVTVRYAGFVALYLVLSQVAGDHRVLRGVMWTLAVSVTLSAALGLERYFNGKAFAASLPGNNQNDFAYILATALPLMLWLFGSSWFQRAMVTAMVAITSAGVLLAFSRGALVGLAAALVLHVVTQPRHLKIVLAGALIAVLGALVFIRADRQRYETSVTVKQRVTQENVDTRFILWRSAATLAVDHPLLGVGPGNFSTYFYESTDSPYGVENLRVVHDAYLDVAVELGFLGLALFVGFLAMAFWRVTAMVRQDIGPPGYAAALRTALVVAVVSALTLSEQYFPPMWLIGGLVTGLWIQSRAAPT